MLLPRVSPSPKCETDRYCESNSSLTLYQSMAVPGSVFLKPPSVSDELGRLVQDQLSKVPYTTTGRRSTLDDLWTMIEMLFTLSSTCTSVLADISAREQESDPFTAVKEIRNVLAWNECSSIIRLVNTYKAELTCCRSSRYC